MDKVIVLGFEGARTKTLKTTEKESIFLEHAMPLSAL